MVYNAQILIVEDSPTQTAQLKHILERRGYHLAAAKNGREAMTHLDAHVPDLILSDIIMPEMDGYQFCAHIKKDDKLRNIPVILLTSLTDPIDVVKGLECGADNFIFKPYDEQYLLNRIAYMLVNRGLREVDSPKMGVEIFFSGQKFFISSDRLQILNLLLSTYETAVQKNRELMIASDELRKLNEQLEARVRERTAALEAEVLERRRAEEEVRRVNSELERRVLERTQQLQAANKELEAFSFSVSHDLRTPLRHIQGYTQLLADEAQAQLSQKGQRYVTTIENAAGNMAQLIDDLLSFSQMSRKEMHESSVDLNRMVQETIQFFKVAAQDRNIDWKVPQLPSVKADPAMLRQVFVNLFDNAVKYTAPRDTAEIELGCTGQEEEWITLYVRDNGVGFNMKYAQKLFGVFQRMHRAEEFEGTGIGLANVRRIITRHGGRIWAEAAPDKGATFFFTLKRCPARDKLEIK